MNINYSTVTDAEIIECKCVPIDMAGVMDDTIIPIPIDITGPILRALWSPLAAASYQNMGSIIQELNHSIDMKHKITPVKYALTDAVNDDTNPIWIRIRATMTLKLRLLWTPFATSYMNIIVQELTRQV